MKTLWDPEVRSSLASRLGRLTPESKARWGRMTVDRMLAHLGDVQRAPLHDPSENPPNGLLTFRPLAYALVHWLPWPKGRVQAPPEGFATAPVDFEPDRVTVLELIRRFAEQDVDRSWPPHPLFGRMTGRDWGVFCYRHLNHHLEQFGV